MQRPSATRPHGRPALVAAGLVLRRRTPSGDRYLLLRSARHKEWGFPKGHQERGESLVRTALRECAEECGIALLAIDGDPQELSYQLPDGRTKKAVYFPAITSSESIVLSHEHSAWLWTDAAEVRRRLPHPDLARLFAACLLARDG